MTVHKVGPLDTAWYADYLSSSLVGAVAGERAISRMSATLSTSRSVRPRTRPLSISPRFAGIPRWASLAQSS